MATKLAFVSFIGTLTVLGSACSESICDRAEASSKAIADKGEACRGDGGLSAPDTFDLAKCEAEATSCTQADLKILNSDLDCADRVAACTAGNDLAWLGALTACAQGYDSVTPECLHATLSQ